MVYLQQHCYCVTGIFCFLLTHIKVNTATVLANLAKKIIFARFMKFLPGVLISFLLLASCASKFGRVLKSKDKEYKLKMANGIVAFEILVTDLQAKKKLSQNRTEIEKQKIIDTLSKSNDTNEQLIAEYMKNEGPGK